MYMLTNTKIENKYSNNSSKIQVTFQNSVVDLATIVCPWESSGQNTGVGCHALLQGIFRTQGLNPGLPNPGIGPRSPAWHADSYCLSHQGKPKNTGVGGGGLVAKSCPTLCNSMNCSPPGSSVHEILQARILEWVAIPFSRGSSQHRNQTWISCIAGRFFTS